MSSPNLNSTFSRLNVRDPEVNRAVQDLYDKFSQVQQALSSANTEITDLKKKVAALTP